MDSDDEGSENIQSIFQNPEFLQSIAQQAVHFRQQHRDRSTKSSQHVVKGENHRIVIGFDPSSNGMIPSEKLSQRRNAGVNE